MHRYNFIIVKANSVKLKENEVYISDPVFSGTPLRVCNTNR